MSDTRTLTHFYQEIYTKKTPRSREIWLKMQQIVPYGVHSNWRIFDPYPLIIARGRGSRVWDIDGNEYIDYNMAFGALIVGHANPVLVERIKQKLEEGTIYGFETEYSYLLAEELLKRFNYEMVRFSTTGSEATMLAIRLARATTNRPKILKFEGHYHGTFEILAVGLKPEPRHAGHPKKPRSVPAGLPYRIMPEEYAKYVIIAPWNDIEAVEQIMREHGNDIAAIILEPIPMNMGVIPADKEFMKSLRELADEYNSLLIYDEVKTCSMWYRGAQEYYGVKADIVAIGKGLGSGLPFSAVLASRELMELIGPRKVPHGGTFNSNPISVYGVYVAVKELLTEANLAYTHKLSDELAKGYKDIIEDRKIDAYVSHVANRGIVYFSKEQVKNWRDVKTKVNWGLWYTWCLGMLINGVIPQALAPDDQWSISIMHTKEDIQKTIEVADKVFSGIKGKLVTPIPLEEAF